MELAQQLAAVRRAHADAVNLPIIIILSDPTHADIFPGMLTEISNATQDLVEKASVVLLTDVHAVEIYANKISAGELRTSAVVHVISHSNKAESVFSGFHNGPLGVHLMSNFVGRNTDVLLSCCYGKQNKGEFLAGAATGRHAQSNVPSNHRPAIIFAFKTEVGDCDAKAIAKIFYHEWLQPSGNIGLAKRVFDRAKTAVPFLFEGGGKNAKQSLKFDQAAWTWCAPRAEPPATYRSEKRPRDDSSFDLNAVFESE